jgi:hypothetical protein
VELLPSGEKFVLRRRCSLKPLNQTFSPMGRRIRSWDLT